MFKKLRFQMIDNNSGAFTLFEAPGAADTDAEGVSNNGQIAGISYSPGDVHGFVDVGGTFTSIGFNTFAYGINDRGKS